MIFVSKYMSDPHITQDTSIVFYMEGYIEGALYPISPQMSQTNFGLKLFAKI